MTAATATDLVHAAIAERGRISFADFMQIALYAPDVGYYSASTSHSRAGGSSERKSHSGPPHDFYTAPQLHAVFGTYIARHLAQVWQELGEPQHFDIVEMGAGRGILAWDILNGLRNEMPQCWRCAHYQLVDRGPGPSSEQQQALTAASAHDVVISQTLTAPVVGVVLSNELLDALPVHRVRLNGGVLREVYVAERDGRLREEFDDPSCPELGAYVERLGRPPEGWQGEICLAAPAWLQTVADKLTRGAVITIDYGATWEELSGPRHLGGTLACYYRHRVGKDPYCRIGTQDITAHVNFSALMEYGESVGLSTIRYQSQAEYLMGLGIGEHLAELARRPATTESIRAKRAITDLIWPDGLGGFRVLVQQKGVLY